MFDITYKETGWRRVFACYHLFHNENDDTDMYVIARWYKIPVSTVQLYVEMVEECLANRCKFNDLVELCLLLEKFSDERDTLYILRALALDVNKRLNTVERIREFTGDFMDIPKIGRKYAAVLDNVQKHLRGAAAKREVHFRIPNFVYDKLKEASDKTGDSMSDLVSELVVMFLDKWVNSDQLSVKELKDLIAG